MISMAPSWLVCGSLLVCGCTPHAAGSHGARADEDSGGDRGVPSDPGQVGGDDDLAGADADADAGTGTDSDSGATDADSPADVDGGDSATGSGGDGDPTPGAWVPALATTWQWQLAGTVNESYAVAMYDIDLFDSSQAVIDRLHAGGKKVVCYFSAGSGEDWRDDYDSFAAAALGDPLDGWAGERWLDVRHASVAAVMEGRLDLAVAKGCDGVEPDNVDAYANDSGFPLTGADQLSYNRFLADAAHARGLAVGLKNDLDQVDALVSDFDFALNEECHAYDECELLAPFIAAEKPVFHVEYAAGPTGAANKAANICDEMLALGFRTLILPLDLDDAFRVSCDD